MRFKCGCEWVRLPHDAFPLMREPFPNHKLGTANGLISGGLTPLCGIALTHSSALSVFFYQHRLEGPRWALRFNIMSQRKKGCESLTYPFPGFNFYIGLSTTHTCQDNVSRLVLDSVEAWWQR